MATSYGTRLTVRLTGTAFALSGAAPGTAAAVGLLALAVGSYA
ncbi:hypothetical protein [Halorarius halobius]|nr:hypothetical protein [Halorarius halobius]